MNTDTRAFLLHLWRGGVWGTYFTLPKKITYWQRASDPGNLPKNGTHIYFSVHPVNERPSGQGRTTNALVSAVNCLYADVDGKHYADKPAALAHVLQIDPAPTVIIDSGGGWHVYWMLIDPYPVTDDNRAQIRHLQDRWVAYTGGDPSSKDLAHILRPPGTVNRKTEYNPPRPVSIYQYNWTRLYTLDELAAVLPAEPVRSASASMAHATTGGADLDRVRSALQRLAPWRCDQHQAWIEVGMSLQELGTDGLALWDNWSAGCPDKYKPGECEKRWRSFDQDGRGLGSLYYWADQDSPRPINGSTPMTTTATNPTVDDRTPSIGAASSTEPEFPDELPPVEIEDIDNPVLDAQQQGHQAADRWGKPYTLVDAFKPRPPAEYAISGLFRIPSLNMIVGAPGDLKTMLVAQAALCVAAGLPFLPAHPALKTTVGGYNTLNAPAMYIDFDNGEDDLHERFMALAKAAGVDLDIPLYYYSFPEGGLDAGDKKHIGMLAERMQDLKVKFLAVDNLGVVKGKADENSDQMIPVMNNFRWLCQATRSTVVLIHHQRKSKGDNSRSGDKIRGHSSIEAALNLGLAVEREAYSDRIKVSQVKQRGYRVLPFMAEFTYDHLPGTDDLNEALFYGIPMPDNVTDKSIDLAILASLLGCELNKTSLTDAVKESTGQGINRIQQRIDACEQAGKIKIRPGNRTAKLYSLP